MAVAYDYQVPSPFSLSLSLALQLLPDLPDLPDLPPLPPLSDAPHLLLAVIAAMLKSLYSQAITSLLFLLYLPFYTIFGLPLFVFSPLLLLSLTSLLLLVLSTFLPAMLKKKVPHVTSETIKLTLHSLTLTNLSIKDTNTIFLVSSLVFPSAGTYQHPTSDAPLDPSNISSLTIKSLSLSFTPTLATFSLPLPIIAAKFRLKSPAFITKPRAITIPAVSIALAVVGLTAVSRKAYTPYTDDPGSSLDPSASAALHHPARFHFPYAPSYDYLTNLTVARVNNATARLLAYLPSLKTRPNPANPDLKPPLVTAALELVCSLISITLTDLTFVLLHADVPAVLHARKSFPPSPPTNPTASCTTITIDAATLKPRPRPDGALSDPCLALVGLAISTGVLTADPASPHPDVPAPAITPTSLYLPTYPAPLLYTISPVLSPVSLTCLLPTLPLILLNALTFCPTPPANSIILRIHSTFHLSTLNLHPVLHALDDYIDANAPYTLFLTSLYRSIYTGDRLPSLLLPSTHAHLPLGPLSAAEGADYAAHYAKSIHPSTPSPVIPGHVAAYTALESRMPYDAIMNARRSIHGEEWDVVRGDKGLKKYLEWSGSGVRWSREGYEGEQWREDNADEDADEHADEHAGNGDIAANGLTRCAFRADPPPVFPLLTPPLPAPVEYNSDVEAVSAMLEKKYGFTSPGFVLKLFGKGIKVSLEERGVERGEETHLSKNDKTEQRRNQQTRNQQHPQHSHSGSPHSHSGSPHARSPAPSPSKPRHPKQPAVAPLDTCIYLLDYSFTLSMCSVATAQPQAYTPNNTAPGVAANGDDTPAPGDNKRVGIHVAVGVNSVSWKPDEGAERVSKFVPVLNDGSFCGMVHRLEKGEGKLRREGDYAVEDGWGVLEGGEELGAPERFVHHMVTFTMESAEYPNTTPLTTPLQPTGSAITLGLEDVFVLVLPTLLKAGLDCLRKVGELPYVTIDADAIRKNKEVRVEQQLEKLTETKRATRGADDGHSFGDFDDDGFDADLVVPLTEPVPLTAEVLRAHEEPPPDSPPYSPKVAKILGEDPGKSPSNQRKKNLTSVFGSEYYEGAGMSFDDQFPSSPQLLPLEPVHEPVPFPPVRGPTPPLSIGIPPPLSVDHVVTLLPPPLPPLPAVKSNGTYFNGENLSYRVTIRNVSVALLLDEKMLDSGLLDANISELVLIADSFEENEEIKIRTGSILARGCRIGGSTAMYPKRNAIRTIHLPFKNAAEIGPISVLYSGYSRAENVRYVAPDGESSISSTATSHPFSRDLLDADQVIGTVYVDVKSNIESLYVNVTPSLNAVLFGCIEQLTAKFSEEDAVVQARVEQEKQELEESETAKRLLRQAHQKRVLQQIWRSIDTDQNNNLDQDEVKQVVQELLKSTAKEDHLISSQITPKELERELNNFMNIVDANGDQEISYEELEAAMFAMANSSGGDDSDSRAMRGIVYFHNLQEFTSPSVVHAITGTASQTEDEFKEHLLWKNSNGLDDFLRLYESSCGCSRESLNGQDAAIVQRKLVRTVESYAFARSCWIKILAPFNNQPWLLDADSSSTYTSGAIETLATQVQQQTTLRLLNHQHYRYDCTVVFGVEVIEVCAGNALVFSKSLVNLGIKKIHAKCKFIYVSDEDGGLTFQNSNGDSGDEDCSNSASPAGSTRLLGRSPTMSNCETDFSRGDDSFATSPDRQQTSSSAPGPSNNYGLFVDVELTISMQYLDTAHDCMENLISDWSIFAKYCFASAGESSAMGATAQKGGEQRAQPQLDCARRSLNVHCPDYLQIDFTPSAIKTLSKLQESLQVTPEMFEKLSEKRVLEELREFWDQVAVNGETELDSEQVAPIVRRFLNSAMAGSQQMAERDLEVLTNEFIRRVDLDGDNAISYHELEVAVRSRTLSAKSVFENDNLIRIDNRIGKDFHYATTWSLEDGAKTFLEVKEVCTVGKIKALSMSDSFMQNNRTHSCRHDEEELMLHLEGYEIVPRVRVSAFQSIAIPLHPTHKSRKMLAEPASAFPPAIIVHPETDSLETVTLQIRSCFTIKAHTPLHFEIVKVGNNDLVQEHQSRYGGNALYSSGSVLSTLLNDANSVSVFEKKLKEGESAFVPLHVMTSTHLHLLCIRDSQQEEKNRGKKAREQWRDPIVLTRNWLWNFNGISAITELHSACCINVERIRLSAISPTDAHRSYPSGDLPTTNKRSSDKAWETIINILPSIIVSNAMPFSVDYLCYQDKAPQRQSVAHVSTSIGKKSYSSARRLSQKLTGLGSAVVPKATQNRQYGAKFSAAASHAAAERFEVVGTVKRGEDIKLNGVDMQQPLFIVLNRGEAESGVRHSNSKEDAVKIDLASLRPGRSIENIKGRLEDEVDFRVNGVTLRNQTRRLTIFSPYWIMNKTGMLMSYSVSGRKARVHDSCVEGTTPVLADSGDRDLINLEGNSVSCAPNEGPFPHVVNNWWNKDLNGEVKCSPTTLVPKSGNPGDSESNKIGLDNVGQEAEIMCGSLIFRVSVETMTGVFHGSNLTTLWPGYFVRNEFTEPIDIVALSGKRQTLQSTIDHDWDSELYESRIVRIAPRSSCVIYSFDPARTHGYHLNASSMDRFVAFRTVTKGDNGVATSVNDSHAAFSSEGKKKTHLIPVRALGNFYYSERLPGSVGLSKVIVCKNTKSEASTILTISDSSAHPPYRIENRSNDHSIIFIQDDDFAEPIMLPPMTWCSYAWDNPQGKLRLRVVTEERAMEARTHLSGLELSAEHERIDAKKRKKRNKKLKRAFKTAKNVFHVSPSRKNKLLKNNKSLLKDMSLEVGGVIIGEDGIMRDPVTGKELDGGTPHRLSLTSPMARAPSVPPSPSSVSDSKLSFQDVAGFDAVHLRNRYIRLLFSKNAKTYCIDKVGERKDLPCPSPDSGDDATYYRDRMNALVKIIKGTKVVSFNQSNYKAKESKNLQLASGKNWKSVQTSVRVQGLAVCLIDDEPKELLNIVLRDFLVEKKMDSIEFLVRLRHMQIDNMLDDARYPVILGPADKTLGLKDDREEARRGSRGEEGGSRNSDFQRLDRAASKASRAGNIKLHGSDTHHQINYWEDFNQKPIPLLEVECDYLPLTHMVWVPKLQVFLCPLKVQIDLSFMLKVVDVIMSSIPDPSSYVREEDVQEAYKIVERQYEPFVHAIKDGGEGGIERGEEEEISRSDLTYVESLYITHTHIEIELFLRPEEEGEGEKEAERRKQQKKKEGEGEEGQGADEDEDYVAMSSTLDTIGRSTSSSIGASMLTWLTNVGASFAHISPTFEFHELKIENRFGPASELGSSIMDHYLKTLMFQSYKLLSIHLLGDPFSLVNSVTSSAVSFITITKDELMAGGKDGFGGGVTTLMQGVVGAGFKSTSMILGGTTDLISETVGNGQAMQSAKNGKEQPHHLVDGMIMGGEFFAKSLMRGVTGVFQKPASGARKGPIGFTSGLVMGVGGLVASPFVATFGATAMIAESVDATTRLFDQRVVECRVRPKRSVLAWGHGMGSIDIPTIKGLGVKLHNLQFVTTGDREHASTKGGRKKIVLIAPDGSRVKMKCKKVTDVSLYSSNLKAGEKRWEVVFENDVHVVRSSNLQLQSELRLEVWDKGLHKGQPLAICLFTVGDIWSDMSDFHRGHMEEVRGDLSTKGVGDWKDGMAHAIGANMGSEWVKTNGTNAGPSFTSRESVGAAESGARDGGGRQFRSLGGQGVSSLSVAALRGMPIARGSIGSGMPVSPKPKEFVVFAPYAKNLGSEMLGKMGKIGGDLTKGVVDGVVDVGKGTVHAGGAVVKGVGNFGGKIGHTVVGRVKGSGSASGESDSVKRAAKMTRMISCVDGIDAGRSGNDSSDEDNQDKESIKNWAREWDEDDEDEKDEEFAKKKARRESIYDETKEMGVISVAFFPVEF